MDVTIQRTGSDRSQNGGPRVSFNRDVHVKRIGPRPNPISADQLGNGSGVPSSSASLFRRELPTDLTADGIRKEAALVLAQADSVKCTAEGGSSDIVGGRVSAKTRGPIEKRRSFDYNSNKIFSKDPGRFHSLPNRKSRSKSGGGRPVARSVSDASSKKSAAKRPSIFSIFSRKSESNLHDSSTRSEAVDGNATGSGNNNRKRVGRSKSDVGTHPLTNQLRRRTNSENEEHLATNTANTLSSSKKNRAPLSPIIEQSQREDYFSSATGGGAASDAKATKSPAPAPPKRRDKRNGNRSTGSRSSAKQDRVEPIDQEDILQIIPAKPVAEAIKDTISTLKRSNSRTAQDMHSSQLPQQKPPLTKGVTVDGMVKRLSMERFSPPPHLSGPAFSYTRPKDQVIYAQVVVNNEASALDGAPAKQTVHTSHHNHHHHHQNESGRGPSPARNGINSPSSHHLDVVDGGRAKTTSASHTQQQRHNSDEDEGLGLEIKARAVHDDFMPASSSSAHENRRYSPRDQRSVSDEDFKSVAEDMPITPKIRDVPPEKYVYPPQQQHPVPVVRGRGDGMDGMQHPGNEFGDLSHRRAILESKINNRRFGGSRELLTNPKDDVEEEVLAKGQRYHNNHTSSYQQEYPTGEPVRMTKLPPVTTNRDFVKRLSPPSRDIDDLHAGHQNSQDRYHRSRSTEANGALSSGDRRKKFHEFGSSEVVNRYSPERSHLDMVSGKYPQNGVSSKYEEESRYFHDGRDGYKETVRRETSIGPDGKPRVSETVSRERLDTPQSDFYRDKYVKETDRRPLNEEDDLIARSQQHHHHHEWRSGSSEPSRRHQKLQRSFDRGDSGIENDYRKDSFNDRDRDLRSKWKQRTYDDDRKSCESFLRKERRHTAENHPVQWRRSSYGFRERSIDDGSHFDPRLDKYSEDGTLRRRREKSADRHVTGEKKKSGLEKVKQLLSGVSSKKNKSSTPATTSSSSLLTSGAGSSTLNRSDKLIKERRGHHEEASRPRHFSETRIETQSEFVDTQIPDISTRRRLSTPKASPALPKRSSSQKSTKSSSTSDQQPPRLSWFKSLDRLSRKKDKTSTLPPPSSRTSSVDERFNGLKSSSRAISEDPALRQQPTKGGGSSKTLRFFGDTDIESNASYSKASWKNKGSRQPLTSQKAISKSAYDLDTITTNRIGSSRHKSASLQHLDETDRAANGRHLNGRYNSKSRDLHDISESASDNELAAQQHHNLHNGVGKKTHHSSSLLSSSTLTRKPRSSLSSGSRAATLNRNGKLSSYEHDDDHGRRSSSVDANARISTLSRHDYRKPPPAPQKPARTFEKRRSVSRGERDRVQDSSGTEGDSSQVSRGSVVFLHATTVGDIPQPQWLNSRSRAASRDSLSSKSTKNQPMTRTVSRSYSVLSPWTPKHLRDGYEINYSQESNQKMNGSKSSHNAKHKQGSSSTSTLPTPKTRPSTTSNNTNTMTRYKKHTSSNKSAFDKSSLNNHSGYRPAAAMDKPVERRISQQRRSHGGEDPERYSLRRTEPVIASRYH